MKTHSRVSPTQFRDRLLLALVVMAIPLLQTYPVWSQATGTPAILSGGPASAAAAPSCMRPPEIEYQGKQITRDKIGFSEYTPTDNRNLSGIQGSQFANRIPPKYFLELRETRELGYRAEGNYGVADWAEGLWLPGYSGVATNCATNTFQYSCDATWRYDPVSYTNVAEVTAYSGHYHETNEWTERYHFDNGTSSYDPVVIGRDDIVGAQTQGNPAAWTFTRTGTSAPYTQTIPVDWWAYAPMSLNATATSNLFGSTAMNLSYQWNYHYVDDYHWRMSTTMNLHQLVDSLLTRTLDLSDEYTTQRFYNDARGALNALPWGAGGTATATLNSTEDNLTLGRLRYRLRFPTQLGKSYFVTWQAFGNMTSPTAAAGAGGGGGGNAGSSGWITGASPAGANVTGANGSSPVALQMVVAGTGGDMYTPWMELDAPLPAAGATTTAYIANESITEFDAADLACGSGTCSFTDGSGSYAAGTVSLNSVRLAINLGKTATGYAAGRLLLHQPRPPSRWPRPNCCN